MKSVGPGDQRRLILHIGTEKTGSTAIQGFLKKNRVALTHQGYSLPTVLGEPEHWLFPLLFYAQDQVDDLSRRAGLNLLPARERVKEQVRIKGLFGDEVKTQGATTWLLSSEHIHSRLLLNKNAMSRLRDFVDQNFDQVRILVYLRDPIAAALSLWSTSVLGGGSDDCLPGPDHPYYHNLCNHRQTLEAIEKWFPGMLMARLYLPEEFVNGNILYDYAECVGIDNRSVLHFSAARKNKSLSWLSLKMIAKLNRDGQASMQRIREIRQAFDHYPPPHARCADIQAYRNSFAASDQWVLEHYFPGRDSLFASTSDPMSAIK